MINLFILILLLVSASIHSTQLYAQADTTEQPGRTEAPTPFVHYGQFVATLPIEFKNGFLFVTMPVEQQDSTGQKVTRQRKFLIDIGVSSDGNFLPDDTTMSEVSHAAKFRLPVSKERAILAELVPTYAKTAFRKLEPKFFGVLGYAFVKRYVWIFDFAANKVHLYSQHAQVLFTKQFETSAITIPYHDDAIITYCNCHFASMWIDAKVPPLREGRIHPAFSDNASLIFKDALDDDTRAAVEESMKQDSLTGKNEFGGIQVASFIVGEQDIASQNNRRVVTATPARYKNLSINVNGTLAMDVIRKYRTFVIDPAKMRLMLLK